MYDSFNNELREAALEGSAYELGMLCKIYTRSLFQSLPQIPSDQATQESTN